MPEAFDLELFLPYRLNRAAEAVSLRFAAQYRERYRMTRPEWRTLALLGTFGRLTATEIGRRAGMHKTKVSRAVFALEQRRWLKRIEDPGDRRVEQLELTPAGLHGYREIEAMARDYAGELDRAIGAGGIRALHAGLAAVERAIDGRG